jgi:hypothetical protein
VEHEMNDFDDQIENVFNVRFNQHFPKGYLRSLSPLEIREQNGGRPIPEK